MGSVPLPVGRPVHSQARMSYYRYITGVYKSYWPGLNRTLRSTSVPRTIPGCDIDCGTYGLTVSGLEPSIRMTRATSAPPTRDFYSSSVFLSRYSATPFRDRAASVPPRDLTAKAAPIAETAVRSSSEFVSSRRLETTHYTDFDCKVMDYMGKLGKQEMAREAVSQARGRATESSGRGEFSSNYDFYAGNKHENDFLYKSTRDVLGNWKMAGKSKDTLTRRNDRATSPLISRGLDRYFGSQRRVDYLGDQGSGRTDFRHYNYRRVPYLGGSDYMKHIPKHLDYLNEIPNQRFKYGKDFKMI